LKKNGGTTSTPGAPLSTAWRVSVTASVSEQAPVPCSICSRQLKPLVRITVSALCWRTAGSKTRSPTAFDRPMCSGLKPNEPAMPQQSMQLGPQFELTSLLIQAVASGIGVGLVPSFLVEDELRSGVLQLAFDLPLVTGAHYCLFVPPDKLKLPPIAAFVQWLQQLK
jgi:DNA-binding transcriptional LysR family regulator